jgi:integrase
MAAQRTGEVLPLGHQDRQLPSAGLRVLGRRVGAERLLAHVEDLQRQDREPVVFPAPDGGMVRDDFKFAVILRRAMARAGVVEGYLQVCRKKGCQHEEWAADNTERSCPKHAIRLWLWPKPIVRKITFHHLRHTAGSLFLMSGVPLEVVQKMLRHTDPKITEGRILLRRCPARGGAVLRRERPASARPLLHPA